MPETTVEGFDKENFKPEEYVTRMSQECVGGGELQKRKSKIQNINDEISSSLKKHVYENYLEFIETAKEISHLESAMYQLSHVLIEQRNLLSTMREESLLEDQKNVIDEDVNDPNADEEQQNKKAISMIMDSLGNYNGKLDNKIFLYEGGLIELDSTDYRPICRVHLFLFNDILIIAKVKHDKKLEFFAQYETKKIATINIKDLDGVKNAIKLMTNDDSKIFQCINSAAKLEWIEKLDSAIKPSSLKAKKAPAPSKPIQAQISATSDLPSPEHETMSIVEKLAPDWLLSAPEEILAEIAQRHFEDSLALVQKCDDFLAKDQTFQNATEIVEKVKSLKTTLSAVLLHELSNSQSRNLQAALRSCRRPLKLLVEMGKSREACGILLRVCTTAIRTSQRQARRNNLAISELFFCDLAQVASEFLKAFSSQAACTSALVVWCNMELKYFASQLIKHYLTKGTPLETVAKFVEGVRSPCAKLTEIGLNLSYHMEGLLRNALEGLIEESKLRILETIGRTEDVWQPHNLQTKSNLKMLLKDFDAFGIDLSNQVTGDTWINLSQVNVNFCRHYLTVTESCAIIAKNESLRGDVEQLLREFFVAQHNTKPSSTMNVDLNFVSKNKSFLVDVLLTTAMKKFGKITGQNSGVLSDLQTQLKGPPKPKPRSIYKTEII